MGYSITKQNEDVQGRLRLYTPEELAELGRIRREKRKSSLLKAKKKYMQIDKGKVTASKYYTKNCDKPKTNQRAWRQSFYAENKPDDE